MQSVSELRALQERENRKQRRGWARDELIGKTDRLHALQRQRGYILDRMAEVRADRSMVPFERGMVLNQLEAAGTALLTDIMTLQARVKSLARELDL